MLIAAIKDFFRAIKNFNLTGNFIPPTFVQDIEALASLHNGSAEQSILSTTYRVRARPSYGTKGGATCNQPTICTRNKGSGDTSYHQRTKGGVSYLGDHQPRPYCLLPWPR